MQFYCEGNQEVLDTIIQAYKVAEQVLLPAMVILDAFVLSHTSEIVDIPDQALVDEYLPPYKPPYRLDVNDPHAFGGLAAPGEYMEFRYKMQRAMEEAKKVAREADEEFGRLFGRRYGLVEGYRLDGAEVVLVTSGTVASTSRDVIDDFRERGIKVGMLKIRLFRPFPAEEVKEALEGARKVAVIDRNISFGHGGIFAQEIKSVLYNAGLRTPLFGFIAGLGGRDVTPQLIGQVLDYTLEHDEPPADIIWMGVKR